MGCANCDKKHIATGHVDAPTPIRHRASSVGFHEKLQVMRLSAAMLYDSAYAKGLDTVEISKSLEPIHRTLANESIKAVKDDLAGVLCAISLMTHEVEKNEQDAKFFIQKSVNVQEHIDRLKIVIAAEMRSKGVSEMMHDGYTVTLTIANGKDHLTIR